MPSTYSLFLSYHNLRGLEEVEVDLKWSQFNIVVELNKRKQLIYNTATKAIVLADSKVINALKRGAFDEVGESDLSKLERAGVIVNSDLDEAARMEYSIGQTKYGRMRALSMFLCLTSQCNLRCVYCFQDYRLSSGAVLGQKELQSLLRFIDREVEERALRQLNVVFFGGEPLMNQEMVIAIAEELSNRESKYLSIDTSLITNGTLLNGVVARLLAKHVGLVQITLDGPKPIHDKRRPYINGMGTYEVIIGNLVGAVELFRSVAVHCVVDSETATFIPELLEDLERRGLKQGNVTISFAPTYPTQRSLANCPNSVENLNQAQIMADLFVTAVSRGWRTPFPFLKGPCGRIQMDFMAIDEKLQVYKCPGELYGPRPDGIIRPDGRLELKQTNWFESVSFSPACAANCVYGPICYGGCRWFAGGPKRTRCSKHSLDATIGAMLKAYVYSKYRDKLPSETTDADIL